MGVTGGTEEFARTHNYTINVHVYLKVEDINAFVCFTYMC